MIDLHRGDCVDVLPTLPPASVNLVVTSPPYAMMRADKYGGIEPDAYPDWWMTVMEAIDHVLAPGGTVMVNWKSGRTKGTRLTWDLRTTLEVVDNGWKLVERMVWNKVTTAPGAFLFGFRDNFEDVLVFSRESEEPFCWNNRDVGTPRINWNRPEVTRRVGPGGRTVRAESQRKAQCHERTSPSTVLDIVAGNRWHRQAHGHPSTFPPALPRFFIRLLSNPGDVVLDPFAGSGTTLAVALEEGRKAVGVELKPEYSDFLEERFSTIQTTLLTEC